MIKKMTVIFFLLVPLVSLAAKGAVDTVIEKLEPKGKLVLTDIPAAYNGKYASFIAFDSQGGIIFSCKNKPTPSYSIEAVNISRRGVSLPLWFMTGNDSTDVSGYSGDDILSDNDIFAIIITTIPTYSLESVIDGDVSAEAFRFSSIAFNKGNVTKSANGWVKENVLINNF